MINRRFALLALPLALALTAAGPAKRKPAAPPPPPPIGDTVKVAMVTDLGTIELELDRCGLWLQLAGEPGAWRLRFVLCPERRGQVGPRGLEAGWCSAASPALVAALQAVVIPQAT